ncbi:MAG TPA: metallophosphoesterase [Chryseosolibacter sp.]
MESVNNFTHTSHKMQRKIQRRKFVETIVTVIGGVSLSALAKGKARTKPVRFGIITDPHYADRPPLNNRYYRDSLAKVSECVELMNEQNVDFLIELGDLKDQGVSPKESETLDFLSTIEKVFQRFNGPLYHVLGNHDHDSISKQQFLDSISNHGFQKARNYYSFNKNRFHFVVLDANFMADGKPYDHGNFDWRDAHIPDEQLAWLRKDLKINNTKPTVVFVHQQLDSIAFEPKHRVHCPSNADAVRGILEEAGNVMAVFQGHFHDGSLNTVNDIYYYTLKAVVEGSGLDNNNYAIVEIDDDQIIRIKGFRKTKSDILNGI